MPEVFFDRRIAARYDEAEAVRFEPSLVAATVDVLSGLAGDGSALEFAIGTGRIALPLIRAGVPVHGIDLSEPMVEQMRAKPGGADVPVTIGDIATTTVPGRYRLVYLVFNTITNLTTQSAQVACFRNAAAHLEPGGSFVVEVSVPGVLRLQAGSDALVYRWDDDHVDFDTYDVAAQTHRSHHMWREAGQWESTVAPYRHVWPSELDLMAQLAGMSLASRWGDWDASPFTSDSRSHVSVWTNPG
jgi:hypothetical protein